MENFQEYIVKNFVFQANVMHFTITPRTNDRGEILCLAAC